MPETLNYNQEIYRKFIHILSSIIAILLWIMGKDLFLPYIIASSVIILTLDYSRRYFPFLQNLYFTLFGIVTRLHEKNRLTGASWVFLGAAITVLLFNEKIAIISLLVMSFSDSAAAIIGIKYGKTKLFNKSLEGTCAFFITTSVLVFSFSPAIIIINCFAVLTATIIELFSTSILNDNLLVPLVLGFVLALGGVI